MAYFMNMKISTNNLFFVLLFDFESFTSCETTLKICVYGSEQEQQILITL